MLTNVNHQMAVMREESFGPVVGIMKVADDEEAVTLMNDSPYGLTASIWTEDLDAVGKLGARVETGTVYANRCDYLDPALVWTGVKETGKGGGAERNRLPQSDAAQEFPPQDRLRPSHPQERTMTDQSQPCRQRNPPPSNASAERPRRLADPADARPWSCRP